MYRTLPTVIISTSIVILTACSLTDATSQTTQSAQIAPTRQVTPTSSLGLLSATSAPTDAPTVVPRVTRKVERGTIDDQITLDGQVTPVQHDLSFAQDGVLKRVVVQVGQQIKGGDLVAELDLGDLETQLRQAQLTAKQDQAQINRTRQAAQLVIRQAEINVETERAKLEALKAPATAISITKAQTTLRQAQTNLETVRNNASQAKNLAYAEMIDAQRALEELRARYAEAVGRAKHPSSAGPNQSNQADDLQKAVEDLQSQVRQGEDRLTRAVVSFDTARNNEVAAVQGGEAAVEAAQAELNALLAGPDLVAIAEQERVVRRAQLAVDQARQAAQPDPAQQRAVQSDGIQIQQIQSQIEDRRLYAAIGGEVATLALSAGSPVQAGSPIITLVDNGHFEFVADATEALADGRTSLLRVGAGQPVQIRFSRYADETFTGSVVQAPKAQSDGSAPIAADYHISFDAQNHTFSVGDTGQIQIALGRKHDVLTLPPSAVHITRDRTYVIVPSGDNTRRVDVVTGIVTESQIEIVSGLKQGDTVIDDAGS